MQPSIGPVLDLSSLVDRISPNKLRVVTLYKLFSAIQQLHPATDQALQQAYVEYRSCRERDPELDQAVMGASDAASFQTVLEAAGCSALLAALTCWAETMNLARWSERKGVRMGEESLEEYAVSLGYSVLSSRYNLESTQVVEDVDFPMVYDFLQQVVVLEVPELDLPSLNDESNRLTLPLFDPTRTTAGRFREECIEMLDDHIQGIDRSYGFLGYTSTSSKKKSTATAGKTRPSKKRADELERFSKTERDRLARAVWDVMTAETFEQAAAKAAEHQYLIEADTLRLAVRDVAGPLIKPETQTRYSVVDGILYTHISEDET